MRRRNVGANPLDALPDFQNFQYTIGVQPVGSQISAWVKLREAEGRLTMYKWAEQHNAPTNPQHRILLNDSVSAFLLTFEATIQFLKDQFKQSGASQQFDVWFAQQSENDVYVKGLRTLRHFEAHVEVKPIPRTVHVHISATLGGGKSATEIAGCTWQLPKLTPADLSKLQNSPLSITDLRGWDALVANADTKTIFTEGLSRLKSVLETAEKVI